MKNYLKTTLFILIILFAFPALLFPGDNRIMIDSDNNVYLSSYTNDNEWKRITKITKYDEFNKKLDLDYTIHDPNNCALDSLSLDPAGNKIIYISYCKLKNASPSDNVAQAIYRLTVIDIKSKKEIISFNHGFYFSISPHGNAIVYAERIAGEQDSPHPPGYQGGAWIYNFNTKTRKQLKVGAVDINWSAHDGNIYSSNGIAVYRYNVKTGKVEATPYHGIYFSPDGKYNINNYDRFRIFRTSDNQEMIELENQIKNYQFICWADNKINSAIFGNGEGENIIFDLEQGKIIARFSGGFIGRSAEGTKIAVRPLGPDRKPQIDKIEIINLLDLIQK